jgi:lipoprotein signal peptidase
MMMTKKEVIILLSIVAFDLITKLAANYYLPFQEDVNIIGDHVGLYLTYNDGATGVQGEYLVKDVSNKNLTVILVCLIVLVLLAYILYIRKRKLKTFYKVLIGISMYLTLIFLLEYLDQYLSEFVVSSWIASVVNKLTGLTIFGSLFWLTRNKWIKLFSVFILSCGIGNLLSHFYLPYHVIDFIHIDGTYEYLKIGVFNFADLAYDIGGIGLIIAVIALIYRKFRTDKSKTAEITS